MAKGRYDKVDRDINKIINAFENPNSGMVQVETCMLHQGYMGSLADKLGSNPNTSHLEAKIRSLSGACDAIYERSQRDPMIKEHIIERRGEMTRAQAMNELFGGGKGTGNTK